MDLIVNSSLVIVSKELKWRFSKATGPGGQNINKNDTSVELIYNLKDSPLISHITKKRLLEKLKNRLKNGSLIVSAKEKRSQFQNRKLALEKMADILREGLNSPAKERKKTNPTLAAKNRRIQSKKYRGLLKKKRQDSNLVNE